MTPAKQTCIEHIRSHHVLAGFFWGLVCSLLDLFSVASVLVVSSAEKKHTLETVLLGFAASTRD